MHSIMTTYRTWYIYIFPSKNKNQTDVVEPHLVIQRCTRYPAQVGVNRDVLMILPRFNLRHATIDSIIPINIIIPGFEVNHIPKGNLVPYTICATQGACDGARQARVIFVRPTTLYYRSRKCNKIFQHFGMLFLLGTLKNVPCSLNELLVNFRDKSSGIVRFCKLVSSNGWPTGPDSFFLSKPGELHEKAVQFSQF